MKPSFGKGAPIDVAKLIESRLLIQANSGSGKSWAIRRLLEQTYGKVQHILIDVDGEFHTLREQLDYVLAGPKGDCPADIKSAALLARRLLELNVSAIVDIYELGAQRKLFVKRFLDGLVSAPRDLWHPVLVVVDEAHIFAPEAGQSESASAVIDLMTLGRKRGFCGVLATQRISKLHKDAAAECNNKLIGRSALDIDMKRAAAELGFTTREDTQSLRTLKAGEFYAFGPALSDEVKLIKVGDVETTHLRAGQRASLPAAPSEKVKKMLSKLADLPHEAEEEARSINEWRAKTKQLEAELRKAKSVVAVEKVVEKPAIDKAQLKRIESAIKQGEKVIESSSILADKAGDLFKKGIELLVASNLKMEAEMARLRDVLLGTGANKSPENRSAKTGVTSTAKVTPLVSGRQPTERTRQRRSEPSTNGANGVLPIGERAVLGAAIQFDGLQKKQLTVLTGYRRSTRDAYIARLRDRGYLVDDGSKITATPEGIAALPDAEPLPTGDALLEFWWRELPEGEAKVLTVLVENYPNAVDKAAIDEATGFKRSTRDAYLSRLEARELVENERSAARASASLFDLRS